MSTTRTDLFAGTAHYTAKIPKNRFMTTETHRCWAKIDQSALRHNAAVVREHIGSAELLAVVKADAYGHGLIGVAQSLANEAQLFGVANLNEAIQLLAMLPHAIMILGSALPYEQ